MRLERSARIPRIPLSLQRIQPLIETPSNRLPRHRQLKRRMTLIGHEFGLGRVEGTRGAEAEHGVGDEFLDLGVGEAVGGGEFDVEEVRDAGRGD